MIQLRGEEFLLKRKWLNISQCFIKPFAIYFI